jgi:sugar-specific transcriptional regulator TrmB
MAGKPKVKENEPAPEVQGGQEGIEGQEPVVDAVANPQEVQVGEQQQEHPKFQERIDELKGQIGQLQRSKQSNEQTIEAMAKHNQELADAFAKRLDGVEDQISVSSAPNYEDDPEGYINWKIDENFRKTEKAIKSTTATPLNTQAYSQQQSNPKYANQREAAQEAAQAALHDDYDEIMQEVNALVATDPVAYQTIFSADDKYKAAYEYGTRNRKIAEQRRTGQLDQGYVEGSNPAPIQDITGLTQEDKKAAKNFRISEEKFLAQKKAIIARRK